MKFRNVEKNPKSPEETIRKAGLEGYFADHFPVSLFFLQVEDFLTFAREIV